MTERTNRFVPYEMKSSLIKVLSYDDKGLRGLLQNPFFPEEQYFENLTQFLMLMEWLLDELQFPQRGVEIRVFDQQGAQPAWAGRLPPAYTGKRPIATFRVSVLFRQNASWQGSILWADRGTEAQFRSALELIGLMDSALSAALEEKT